MPSLRELARELRRYGFTQFRHTVHGILYGKEELRFTLLVESRIKNMMGMTNQVTKQWNDWEKLKREHGLQPVVSKIDVTQNEPIELIENPEEDIVEEIRRGDPLNKFDTAAPPFIPPTGGEIPPGDVVEIPSLDVVNEPKEPQEAVKEEEVMPKTKRYNSPCPVKGCDQFATPRHIGLHRKRGELPKDYSSKKPKGERKPREPKEPKTERAERVKPARVGTPVTEVFSQMAEALRELEKVFKDLQYETKLYKEERDALQEKFNVLENMFGGRKR